MLAICTIREQPHYRREAFINGLRRAGYALAETGTPKTKRDVFVIWNRYGLNESRADNWESQGGTVLVAENGYLGADSKGRQHYALAIHGHNGSGWYPMYDEDRFARLGIELAPWVERPDGYDLICGQRGIGSRSMASPPEWHHKAAKRTPQPDRFRIRPHPGALPAATTVEQDLAGAARCVIWSSSSGVKALVLGIPVRYDAPHWICSAAGARLNDAEDIRDDGARRYAMTCMSNAQYSVEELESGAPFATLRDSAEAATW